MTPETHSGRRWRWISQHWDWLVVAMIILSAAAIRVHLLEVPMERDEGEYAYAGQLILRGIPPYAQAYNMKLPGTYAAYALIMSVFGETHVAVHLGLLLINAATALLLFLLGRKLFNALAGLTAAATFAFLSMGQPVQGIFANAEHFVLLPAVGGILLLVYAVESRKLSTLLAAAILMGLGFIMKQHGVAFIAFGGSYLFLREISRRPVEWSSLAFRCLIFIAGASLPFAVTCLVLLQAGVFDRFWFWTVDYASHYVSSEPLSVGIEKLRLRFGAIVGSAILVWTVAAIGLTSFMWNRGTRRKFLFPSLFLVFSFLALVPGLHFRPHYFVLLLPAVALLAGIGASSLHGFVIGGGRAPGSRVIPLLMVFALAHGFWQQREFLFFTEPQQAARLTYGVNPFPESLEVARFIRNNSNENDRIAVIGSEPQIYFYSNRRGATGYIYTYALMESHPYALAMQQEMIEEIERARPRYLIFVNIKQSWNDREGVEEHLLDWFNRSMRERYDAVGIVDIGEDGTHYLWGEDQAGYLFKPHIGKRFSSQNSLLIARRRDRNVI